MEYTINLLWDAECAVWIATSDDVPGLVLESGSFDALVERLRFAVPEMLEENGLSGKDMSICFKSTRREKMCL